VTTSEGSMGMTSHGITSRLRAPGVSSSVAHGRGESAHCRALIMMDGSIGLLAAVMAYIGASGPDRASWRDHVYVIVTMVTPLPWVTVPALSLGHRLPRVSDDRGDSRQVLLAGAIRIPQIPDDAGGRRAARRRVGLAQHRLRLRALEDATKPSCHVDRGSAPWESWPDNLTVPVDEDSPLNFLLMRGASSTCGSESGESW
jgi:hypothetical protein